MNDFDWKTARFISIILIICVLFSIVIMQAYKYLPNNDQDNFIDNKQPIKTERTFDENTDETEYDDEYVEDEEYTEDEVLEDEETTDEEIVEETENIPETQAPILEPLPELDTVDEVVN